MMPVMIERGMLKAWYLKIWAYFINKWMNILERVVAEIELKILKGDSGFSSDKIVLLKRR